MSPTISRVGAVGAAGIALSFLLAACSSADQDPAATATADDHDHEHDEDHDHESGASTEQSAKTPRLVMTYDGGIVVVDANALETEADIALDGFNRLNPLGDERHVAISTTGGFQVLDAGTWSQPHGDHDHYFTGAVSLTDLIIEATTPGHVVVHDGLTAFFDDGTGDVTVFHANDWTHMVEEGHFDVVREYTTAAAHHGVAVATEAGELLVTIGDSEGRSGAMLLDENDEVIVSTEECPGVHGETAFTNAEGESLIMVGCENGVIAFHSDHVHAFSADVEYGRTGNLYSSEGSNIVAGDYKTDPEGGIGLSEIVIIDTAAESRTVVDPFAGADAEYTWRDIRRGDDGQILVLGTDGTLRVLDETGTVAAEIPVVDAWEIPEAWQTAHPAVEVLAGMAYVTEPATGEVHIVDYVGGAIWKSVDVGIEMNEIVGVTG